MQTLLYLRIIETKLWDYNSNLNSVNGRMLFIKVRVIDFLLSWLSGPT